MYNVKTISIFSYLYIQENCKDTKGLIRIRKS